MTYAAAPRSSDLAVSRMIAPGRARGVSASRGFAGDEDRARRALGTDLRLPAAVVAGAELEHLARIALG